MTAVTATPALTREESFTRSMPGTRGAVSYRFTPLRHEAEGIVGVLVEDRGETTVHDLCARCGAGFGHYMWNGEDDLCYRCGGEGFGAAG